MFVCVHVCVCRCGSSIFTKSIVYNAVVLGVLLYAVETWSIKQRELHSLEVFHYRCLKTILGISRAQRIAQHISIMKKCEAEWVCQFHWVTLFLIIGFVGWVILVECVTAVSLNSVCLGGYLNTIHLMALSSIGVIKGEERFEAF